VGKSFSSSFSLFIDKDVMIFITGAIRLMASSVAVYATYCIWNQVSPILWHRYGSLACRDDSSPSWLIEHEKELERAKRSGQRKGSSKKSKRKGSNDKQSQQQSGTLKASETQPSAKTVQSSTRHKTNIYLDHEDTAPPETDERHWETNYYSHSQKYSCKQDSSVPTKVENDKNDERDGHLDGVPSSISISLSSVDNTDDINQSDSITLDEPNPPTNHMFHRHTQILQSPTRKPLLVPTEEQRNEAAERLRAFQNAQIQRLLYRKKLEQSFAGACNSSSISAAPTTPASQLTSNVPFSRTQLVKPPPGFNHQADVQSNQDTQDDTFLTDNELILSKLLDDDEDGDNMDNLSSSSGMDSFPRESSLDPSAAPFVLEGLVDNTKESVPASPTCDSKWDIGRISSLSISENGSNAMMKGVYGGSVW